MSEQNSKGEGRALLVAVDECAKLLEPLSLEAKRTAVVMLSAFYADGSQPPPTVFDEHPDEHEFHPKEGR